MTENLLTRFQQRDQRLDGFITEVFANYQSIYKENRELDTRKKFLETEVTLLRKSSSDPVLIEQFRGQISELQTKLTASYEELTKHQSLSMKRNEEVAELTKKCKELESSLSASIEITQCLQSAIEKRDMNIASLTAQVETLRGEKKRLEELQEKLQEKAVNLENENNQLVLRLCMDKQEIIDQWNEMNKMMEDYQKKKLQLEEQVKQFQEEKNRESVRKQTITNGSKLSIAGLFSGRTTSTAESMEEGKTVDLSMYYTKSSKKKDGKIEFNALKKLKLHNSEIYAITESYVKNFVATAGGDQTVRFFDPQTNNTGAVFKATNSHQVFICLALDKTNEYLLTGATDKTAQIWSINTERVKYTLTGHQDRVTACSFAFDKDRCVTGSADRTIKIYDVNKGNIIKTIPCGSSCTSLQVAKDNMRIISAHTDRTVKVFSLKNGELISTFKDMHESTITSLSLTDDNNLVLTSSRDNTLRLIEMRMNKVQSTIFRHDNYMSPCDYSKACFAEYDKAIVAGGLDGKLYVWNVNDGKLHSTQEAGHEGYITGCCYNFLSGYLYSTDVKGNVVVWQ